MGGIKTTRLIKSKINKVPIIAVTGWEGYKDVDNFFDAVLFKPVTRELIGKVIGKFIEGTG